jgi:hypothetical protein
MLYRLRRRLECGWFDFRCRDILRTPPLEIVPSALEIVTLLCHADVVPYLVAVKSAYSRLRQGRVTVLDDGSLTRADYERLRRHIPGIRIAQFSDVAPAACPKGNCWERLLLIAELCQDAFVIQLDADTVTLAEIPEVVECVRDGRSFTLLGDRSFPEIETAEAASRRYAANASNGIAAVAERSFGRLPDARSFFYIRGNAGFAGFAPRSFSRADVERFSCKMESVHGKQWHAWGSEQVASNLMVANSPRAISLPAPKYASYWLHPEIRYEDCAFIHFIGTHRYAHGLYIRLARQIARELNRCAAAEVLSSKGTLRGLR